MKLLYTVSSGFLNPQSNFVNSLGGYVSSTEVPNDIYNAVFDELSLSEIIGRKNQYRAIVLYNDSDIVLSNVELSIVAEDTNICDYQLAAVAMTETEDGAFIMDSIPNSYSKPTVTFYNATEEPVSVGDMQPNQYIGLWLMRRIDYQKAEEEYNDVAQIDPLVANGNRYKPVEKIKEESFNLTINWN